jgi:hypothetical protein
MFIDQQSRLFNDARNWKLAENGAQFGLCPCRVSREQTPRLM